MSSIKSDEKYKEKVDGISLESEENYTSEEERVSEGSDSGSTKVENIPVKKKIKKFNQTSKIHFGRYKSTFRQRHCTRKNKNAKTFKKREVNKKTAKFLTFTENFTEVPKKGKRCRIGGKAKGKPPEEEDQDKCDSDDDDNSYFSRISLGYFQKSKDKSGASTSHQTDENCKTLEKLNTIQKVQEEVSEEKELLELQQWGMTGFVSCCNRDIEKPSTDNDIRYEQHSPNSLSL